MQRKDNNCFLCEGGIPNNNQEGIKKGYWYLFFEGIGEVCEAFSVPSFPSHRIRARIFYLLSFVSEGFEGCAETKDKR